MKTKNRLLILTTAFFVILGILFAKDPLLQMIKPAAEEPLEGVSAESVATIDVQQGDTITRIEKKDGAWIVKAGEIEFPADNERINNLVNTIANVEKDDIASTNKDRHKDLGIQNDKITLTMGGDETKILFVGAPTQVSKNFVRVGDEEEVFVASGFSTVFNPNDYRDLTIPLVNAENAVAKISVSDDTGELTLEKRDNTWFLGDQEGNPEEVGFYVNNIRTLRASDILKENPVEEQGLTPQRTITVTEDGNDKTLEFFVKDEETYYARTSESDRIYEISTSVYESTNANQETLVRQEDEAQ